MRALPKADRLTDTKVSRYSVPKGQEDVRDEKLAGLVLRVGKRSKSWRCEVDRTNVHTFGRFPAMSVEDARAYVQLQRAGEQRGARLTVSEVWAHLEHDLTTGRRRPDKIRYRAATLLAEFGDAVLDDIRKVDALAYFAAYQHRAPTEANRTLSFAKRLANRAVEMELATRNPFTPVTRAVEQQDIDEANDEQRVLSAAEFVQVWKATSVLRDDDARDFVRLCMVTGHHPGDVGKLTWDQVDFEAGTVTFYMTKGRPKPGRPMRRFPCVVPLGPIACKLLADQRGRHPEFVFPVLTRRGKNAGRIGPRQTWNTIVRRLRKLTPELEHWSMLHMRPTFITLLQFEAGGSLEAAMVLAGHAPGGITFTKYTRRKQRFLADDKHEAAMLWNAWLAEKVGHL